MVLKGCQDFFGGWGCEFSGRRGRRPLQFSVRWCGVNYPQTKKPA